MYKLIKVGDLANIQFKEYLFNSYTDMINFDTNLLNFADKAKVIATGKSYILDSSKNWILQSSSSGGGTDLSDYYTKEEVDDLIGGGTSELLEIKLPIFNGPADEIPSNINLDESSWDNLISINTDMNNGKNPNVLITLFAGDDTPVGAIGTDCYRGVVKPKQVFFRIESGGEKVGVPVLEIMIDIMKITIFTNDLASENRTVMFTQKVFCSQEDLSTAIGDINSVLDAINGEVIE